MRRLFIAAILATLWIPWPANAQEVPVEGLGRPLCRHLQPVDFETDAPVGQWLLGYYSGALAMKAAGSDEAGQDAISERADQWSTDYLLESARAYCVNHPDEPLHVIAGLVVTMVIGE